MKRTRLYLLALLFALGCQTRAESGEMPIIAFLGIPDTCNVESHYRTFSECGFNVTERYYCSLDWLLNACRHAEKYGIKILAYCPEMTSAPAKTARRLKGEKAFFGYRMQDEPSMPDIHKRQKDIEQLKRIDNTHLFYINLLPYYHADWVTPSTKAKNYPQYLRALSATSCQQLSFDHYPITTAGIRPTWYHNLEMIRQESQASGKPFWGFVLSVPHKVPTQPGHFYPTPTLASLRLQIYSNLAYGAQAIQYYTYWLPSNEDGYDYHDAPVTRSGEKTKTYYLVQQMNCELRSVARLFYGAKVLSVNHLGDIPEGTTRLSVLPVNLSKLKVVGRQGAIVSQLTKNGHRYLCIVNKSHEEPLTVRIQPANATPRHLTKQLQEEPMKPSYEMEPGNVLLFRLY